MSTKEFPWGISSDISAVPVVPNVKVRIEALRSTPRPPFCELLQGTFTFTFYQTFSERQGIKK